MVVPVAVFTQRATRASPLHRFIEFTGPEMLPIGTRFVPLRGVIVIIGDHLRHLRFDLP